MLPFMRFRQSSAKLGVVLFAFLGGVVIAAQADSAGLTKEDIAALIKAGEAQASPLFQTQAQRRVVFANTDYFAPTNRLSASANPYPLVSAPQDFASVSYQIDGQQYPLSGLLASDALMGLAAVQDNQILFEYYAHDHSPESRWISFSVTKSISSMLIGAAIQDGYIRSIQDKVSDYLPRLAGSAYGESTIEDLLHMASGIAWNEDYEDPNSDVSIAGALNGIALTDYLAKLPKEAPSGEVFNYNTGEANLVGELLRAAIGTNAAPYLSAKVWQPFGMEHDATWLLDGPNGRETGGCCISASVRDYARLGLFALNDGVLPSGERVLPEGWIAASTTPFADEPEYGYMWWLLGEGHYMASGIFGQKIMVIPDKRLVIGVHSNAISAVDSDYARHLNAAMVAIAASVQAP